MNDLTRQLLADPIGSYPSATVACFDATHGDLPRRMLDADRNRIYLERLAAAGAPAALIAASTGHGHVRMVEELEEWFTASRQANIGKMVLMALLRPEDGQVANEQLLDLLRELEYPVVFFRPGTNLPRDASDEQIADRLRPLVKAAADRELAIGLYTIPDVSGVRLTADAAALVLASPGGERIIAAKITEANYENSTLKYLQHPALARLKIVQGWDPFIVRALQDGPRYDEHARQRCGVTSGPMSLAVFQYVHLLGAAARGDWTEAEASLAAVTALFQSMQDDPGKFADLQRAKAIMGLGQPLKGQVSPAQIERVLQTLKDLPRGEDRRRLAKSLDLLGEGPYHDELTQFV